MLAKLMGNSSYTKDIPRVYKRQVISSAQLSGRENFFQKKIPQAGINENDI